MKRMIGDGALWFMLVALLTAVLSVIFFKKNDSADEDMDSIYESVRNLPGEVGIYAKNLRTGKDLRIHSDDIFISASANKLMAAMGVYKYLYDRGDVPPRVRLEKNVERMLRASDNDAYFESIADLSAYGGTEILQRIMHDDLGLVATQVNCPETVEKVRGFGVTTPRELGKVFEQLYAGQYLGHEYSSRLAGYLAHTLFTDTIPRYFPDKVVMHKAGSFDGCLSDVGVVQDEKSPILISIYVKTEQEETVARNFIAGISTLLVRELAADTNGSTSAVPIGNH